VLSNANPLFAAVCLAVLMALAWTIGWRSGVAARRRGVPPPDTKLDDAALALLGLLLAFTFSMALNKYESRRQAMVTDSNAIGDFYTCATLIPEPGRTRLQDVVREYTRLRVELGRHPSPARDDVDRALARFDQMQGRMTVLVGEAIATGTPIAMPLTNTLNGVTSSQASRLAALRDRVPGSVIFLLGVTAALAAGLVGREQGISPRPSLAGTFAFIVIVALTVYVTLDLNHPTRGFIRISQEPMERLLSSMGTP
jgi:hypothetical protein